MTGKYRAYSEYKDSGVEWLEEVPSHWNSVPIKYMAIESGSLFLDGDWIESKDISSDGIRYITTGNVAEGKYREQGAGYITEDTFCKLDCTEVFEGDILISRLNEPIGRACIVPNLESQIVTSVDNVIFRPDNRYYKNYIVHLFSSEAYFKHTGNLARGATMQRISRGLLGNIRVVVPSLEEQKTIANFLDHETAKIDTLIEKQQQLIKLLKEKRQAVISHAVTKGLNPNAPMRDSGVEWLGEVPEHWVLPKVSHLGKVQNGSTPDKNNLSYWADGTVPWLSSSCLNSDFVTEPSALISRSAFDSCSVQIIPAGSLLVGMVGQGKTRGTSAILSIDSCINQNMAAIIPNSKIEIKFLFYLFNAMYEDLRELGRGGNQAALNCEIIGSLRIPFPPIEEQREIVSVLDDLLAKLALTHERGLIQIDLLMERRTALISAAVTGKIDVRNWQPPEQSQTNQEAAA